METQRGSEFSIMVGKQIQRRREKMRLTQYELCELAILPHNTVAQYESGQRTPSLENALRLANALQCDINDLVRKV